MSSGCPLTTTDPTQSERMGPKGLGEKYKRIKTGTAGETVNKHNIIRFD